jgi:hypothetical protein
VLKSWWAQIDKWRARKCLSYKSSSDVIMPQYAIQRLYALTKDRDVYITTEVGQHQMWAAQFFHFEEPNRWMTSGGLGTMGYGLPAAIGVQMAHPKSLVIDIAGDASILMNMQEMSTAVQFRLPVKVFILNNQYMGMVRQWQQLLHGNRISESYTAAMPDFVKLAEAYGGVGIRCDKPEDLDVSIMAMLNAPADRPVLFDCRVAALANCFPMIPSGKAHHEMLLGEEVSDEDIDKANTEFKGAGGIRVRDLLSAKGIVIKGKEYASASGEAREDRLLEWTNAGVARAHQRPYDFVLLHQGIADKLHSQTSREKRKIDYTRELVDRLKQRGVFAVIIHSGRGAPEIPENTRFIPLSSIENWITRHISKYEIVQELMALKQRKEKVEQ